MMEARKVNQPFQRQPYQPKNNPKIKVETEYNEDYASRYVKVNYPQAASPVSRAPCCLKKYIW